MLCHTGMSRTYRCIIDVVKYVLLLVVIILLSNTISTKLTELSEIPAVSDNPTTEELSKMLAYSRQAESAYITLGYAIMGYLALAWALFIIADLLTLKVSSYTLTKQRVITILCGTLLLGVAAILSLYSSWFILLLVTLYTVYHALLYHRRSWHFLKQSDFWYAYGLYTLLTVLPIILVWYGAHGILLWVTLIVTLAVVFGRAYFRGIMLHETAA